MAFSYALPQNDKNANRSADLGKVRAEYGYDYTYGAPVGTKFALRDVSTPAWFVKVLKGLMAVRSNTEAILDKTGWKTTNPMPQLSAASLAKAIETKTFPDLFDYYLSELGQIEGGGRPKSLEDYQAVFQKVNKTYASNLFLEDKYFAHAFLAGPHANFFRQMKVIPANFPITNDIFRKTKEFSGDNLQQAIASGRVFIADYHELNGLVSGVHPLQKKYIYQPIVAFAQPTSGGTILPFAIQCGQVSAEFPIFNPSDSWTWQMAKGTAWVAHYTYHELLTHLGLTHFLIEPMVVATRRQLSALHPIYGLLSPHFEGTMVINSLAVSSLIQAGQSVDRLVGSTLESNYALISKGRLGYSFKDNFLPTSLKARGLDSTKKLPIYHYRDDAMPIWNAIHLWVSNYVDIYYQSDSVVQADFELQAWADEIGAENGGRVKDFAVGGNIDGKAQLIDICTMIIFTAGPQHAAVNFPQLTDMSFLPGGPIAGYRQAPENNSMKQSDYLNFLPPLDVAIKQWQTLHFLGTVHHTTLGRYYAGTFLDPRVLLANSKFVLQLTQIENDIKQRNRSRIPYEHLLPSLIPQSTNI